MGNVKVGTDGNYRTSDLYVAAWLLATSYPWRVPEGYSVYTEAELEELCKDDVSEATLRLVHEAKKLVGAKVVSVESKKEQ